MEIFNSPYHFVSERKYQRTQKISLTYLDNLLLNDYLNGNVERKYIIFSNRPVLQKDCN